MKLSRPIDDHLNKKSILLKMNTEQKLNLQ